jgi:hypothetical protein
VRAYSTRFFLHTVAGWTAYYTVPAGYKAALKSIVGYNSNATTALDIALEVNGTVVWYVHVPGAGAVCSDPFTLVLNPGDTFRISHGGSGSTGLRSATSGYLYSDAV